MAAIARHAVEDQGREKDGVTGKVEMFTRRGDEIILQNRRRLSALLIALW